MQFLRDLPRVAKRFWLLVVVTGAAAGVGAAALVRLLNLIESLVWPPAATFLEAVQAAGPLRRMLVVGAAGLLVSVASIASRRPLGGHGTAGILEAIWVRAGRLPLLRALGRGVLSIVAVAMGAPLGREGALLQTGASAGSWFADRLRLHPDQRRLLVACGASAGIAAAYNVPIGGALFGLEVLLGSFALELFGPIVVSCVTATLVSRILLADHPTYEIPHYQLASAAELGLDLVIGPILGVASAAYVRGIDGLADLLSRVPRRLTPFPPPLALLAVGAAAALFPELLGNGYGVVDAALLGRLSFGLLVVLPLLKLIATGTVAGAGVPGGLFTPSLFYGALLGGALGQIVQWLLPGVAPPGAYALVGMGAILAGTTHAAVSAVIIIFELTGDYAIILPLMLTCVLATAVSRRLVPESLYSAALRRRNVRLPDAHRPGWLEGVRIAALLRTEVATVGLGERFSEVALKLLELPQGRDLYVVGEGRRYAGVIVLDILKHHLPQHGELEVVIAADLLERIEPLRADLAVSEAVARFAESELDKLPVIHPGTGELLGVVSRRELLRYGRF